MARLHVRDAILLRPKRGCVVVRLCLRRWGKCISSRIRRRGKKVIHAHHICRRKRVHPYINKTIKELKVCAHFWGPDHVVYVVCVLDDCVPCLL